MAVDRQRGPPALTPRGDSHDFAEFVLRDVHETERGNENQYSADEVWKKSHQLLGIPNQLLPFLKKRATTERMRQFVELRDRIREISFEYFQSLDPERLKEPPRKPPLETSVSEKDLEAAHALVSLCADAGVYVIFTQNKKSDSHRRKKLLEHFSRVLAEERAYDEECRYERLHGS